MNEEPYFIDRQLEMTSNVSNDSKMTTTSNDAAPKPVHLSSSHFGHKDDPSDDTRRKPEQPSRMDDNAMTTTSNDTASKAAQLSLSHLHHNDDELLISDNAGRKPDQPSCKNDNAMTTMSDDTTSKPAKTSSSTPRLNVTAISSDTAVSSVIHKTPTVNHTDPVVDGSGDRKDKDRNVDVQSKNMKPPTITVTAEIHNEPRQLQSIGEKTPLPSKEQFKVFIYLLHT